jgi:hypothetical protein
MLSGMNQGRSWGDWMVQEDEDKSQRVLRMTDAHWKESAVKAIANNRGKGDLRPLLNWLDAMEAKREEFKTRAQAVPRGRDMSPAAVTFRAWKDMVLEPSKYSDSDWADWCAWNEELTTGEGRWRIHSFWLEMDQAEQERLRAVCAVRIQAAWRGHAVRDTQVGLSCEDCLARTFAPQQWNGQRLCVGCLEHRFEHFASFVQPVVLPPSPPPPAVEPDEHGYVPCDGCKRVVCYIGDYGEYRPGWWCSRACAYDL